MATPEIEGSADVRVMVLVRSNCPTCVRMESVVREVCAPAGIRWATLDVGAPGADPELAAEYADVVPVALVDGREVATPTLRSEDLADALGVAR